MSAADGAAPRVGVGDDPPRVRLPVVVETPLAWQPLAKMTRGVNLVDMIGKRSDKLVVTERAGADGHGRAAWLCRCDCGRDVVVVGAKLRGPKRRKACGECVPRRTTAKPPGTPMAQRKPQARRSGVRARTISVARVSVKELRRGLALYPLAEHASYARPVTRGDCLAGGSNAARPCPFASCAHHLAVEVNEDNGSIKVTWPDRDVSAMAETCSLDVADRGGMTMEELGAVTNLTRERIRTLEDVALAAIKRLPIVSALYGVEHVDSRGEHADADDGSGERTDADAVRGLSEVVYGPDREWGMP